MGFWEEVETAKKGIVEKAKQIFDQMDFPGKEYKTMDEAATASMKSVYKQTEKQCGIDPNKGMEHGSLIYQNPNGTYSYTPPIKGTIDGFNPGDAVKDIPKGSKRVGDVHSHPCELPQYVDEKFSPTDIAGIKADDKALGTNMGYLVTPSGSMFKYDPKADQVSCLGDLAPKVAPHASEKTYSCPVSKP